MKKILVIEDEASLLENIVELLIVEGYEAYGAENGRKGVEAATKILPDIIVSDISMPEMDGFEALELLRSKKETAAIPFIFLSAKAEKIDVRKGMELGADDFLAKPFHPSELFKAIEVRLAKQEIIFNQSEKKLEELRTSISTNLPHEFRTPLNGIMGSAQMLIHYSDNLPKEELMNFYENIYSSAQRLYRLILNYLIYTELETILSDQRKVENCKSAYIPSIHSIINDSVSIISAKSENKREIDIDIDEGSIRMQHSHFQKICDELLDNALKFSFHDTIIKIKTKKERDRLFLYFVNTGVGLSQDQIANIGAYVQFDRKSYEQQGVGLGLSILKLIMKVYNGDLIFESIPGEQTTVIVSLPI